MDGKNLSLSPGPEAAVTVSPVSDVRAELKAWQDRCALVEAALAAANDVLHRELPGWQERCAVVEASLAAVTARMERELPEWQHRCAVTEQALADATRRLSEEIPLWRDRCELAENALASLDASRKGRSVSHTDAAAFLVFASKFSPAEAVGMTKTRVGAMADGGYVMLDDFVEPPIALSLGIGDETSWDRRMAELGAIVHQYDHTVPSPEGQPSNIQFHQKRIVDVADGTGVTVEEALFALDTGDLGRTAILKIDIEGSEWTVLDAVPDAVLQRFDQIVCEYHDLGSAADVAWFERASRVMTKLSRHFQVVHVHGNNAEPIVVVGGVPFPSVIEVTHASRKRYRFRPSDEHFPTKFDQPNHPERPDLWLGSFSFGT